MSVESSPPPTHTRERANVLLRYAILALVAIPLGLGVRAAYDRLRTPLPALAEEVAPAASKRYAVEIHKPAPPQPITSGATDANGNLLKMTCAECHKTRATNPENRLGLKIGFFHSMPGADHGKLACIACHNAAEANATLRLADGTALAYPEVMQLCAQCHGPQYRSYQHGAHGGMSGYWDLSKGGRTRANCTDCHNPHAPKYQPVQPAQGPNDRGVVQEIGHE
jgi:hypothetical protein